MFATESMETVKGGNSNITNSLDLANFKLVYLHINSLYQQTINRIH